MQRPQPEWREQWSRFENQERFLFEEWIKPATLDDFRDKSVLECGCGGGHHSGLVAAHAREVVAVDLNTVDIARRRNAHLANVTFVEADIASMDLGRQFDVVFSIGVIHHTDDPERAVANLTRHLKPGGLLIVWVYSREGNGLVAHFVEPARKLVLRHLGPRARLALARALCALMYVPVYSLYLLPVQFLPYHEYFANFRRLSYRRNVLNVFDKLNAPQVHLITRERIQRWLDDPRFARSEIRPCMGVSWTGVAVARGE